MSDTDRLAALLCDLFPTAERSRWPFSVQLAAERLIAAGVTLAPQPDTASRELARIKRQAHLAYLYLNVMECPKCHLPSAQGYICPCGYDGAPDE